jgi:DNA-binding NarL/FixJ family response regulator
MTGPAPIRVVIADDDEVVRAGFAALLATRDDIDVVGAAGDGRTAIRVAAAHRPDVVLMDVRMPILDGIAATRRITAAAAPTPRVIVLTTFDLDEYVYDALSAGASGFLLKDVPATTLFDAVRVVARGDALLTPDITRRLIDEFARVRPRVQPGRLAPLTAREIDVLRMLAGGYSNPEIAARLHIATETVKTHVSSLLGKLQARDRTQAVIAAYESGLVHPGAPAQPLPSWGGPS